MTHPKKTGGCSSSGGFAQVGESKDTRVIGLFLGTCGLHVVLSLSRDHHNVAGYNWGQVGITQNMK